MPDIIDPRLGPLAVKTFNPTPPSTLLQDAGNAQNTMALAQQRMMQVKNQQALQAGQEQANKVIASIPRNEDGTYDIGELSKRLAAANVPVDQQEGLLKSFEGVSNSITSYNTAKRDHLADLANTILSAHKQGQPITAQAVQMGAAAARQAGIATDDDVAKINQALAGGTDPEQLLNTIKGASSKYNKAPKFGTAAAGSVIYDENTGQPVSQVPGQQKTEAELAADAATLGTPNQTKTAQQSKDALAMLRGAKPQDQYQTFKDAYVKKLLGPDGKWEDLSADQQLAVDAAYTKSKIDPTTAALAQSNAEIRNLLLKNQLGQEPTKDDAQAAAKAILEHRLAPSQAQLLGGMGNANMFKRMVILEAMKEDPSFNWEQAESDYQFGKSPALQGMVRFIDETSQSIPRLVASADQLANSKVRFANGLQNMSKEQLNNPQLRQFQVDALAVSDGVAKALQGGGTGSGTSDRKLDQAQKLIRETDDPEVVKSAVQEIHELLKIRRTNLTRGTYMATPEGAAPKTVKAPNGETYTDGQIVTQGGKSYRIGIDAKGNMTSTLVGGSGG